MSEATSIPLARVDKLLVENGLVESRALAQKLIDEGQIQYQDQGLQKTVKKHSLKLPIDTEFVILQSDLTKFVSRGGLKLQGAITHTNINPNGMVVLDVGQSTGGFTDCLIQLGAKQVVGIEVGRDQLNPKLKGLNTVICLEGINARQMPIEQLLEYSADGFDLIVMDVSFISQTLILPELAKLLSPTGKIVSLVKPQFEVGKEGLGKGGIVRDNKQYDVAEMRIRASCQEVGLAIHDYFDSPIKGGDGNREFFILASKL